MGSQSPTINAGRWHRPRVYGTIVGLYLFVMSAVAIGVYLIPLYTSVTDSNPCRGTSSGGEISGCSDFIVTFSVVAILSSGIVGASVAAGIMLIRGLAREYVGALAYGALLVWTVLSFMSIFGSLFRSGTFSWLFFLLTISIIKRYPKN